MNAGAWVFFLTVIATSNTLFAADEHGHQTLNPQQQLGRRLFEQSCGVCHTRPTLVSGMFGPELSKDSTGGKEEYMREIISNGSARMPGFKYTYNPEQIAAIASYIKTLPRGTQDIPTARAETKAPTPMQ
ncbi:MAG TPA: cytochrome c [Candidatus Binatia bacterium]|jgi:mono/diheme cytochrome c family protein|nr:cytochrome c [Candidatus Binatia bacterium]